jgi:phage gp46-like protein
MLADLIGQPRAYAESMAEHRIEQAILNDDRFESVTFSNEEFKDGKLILDIAVGTTDDGTVNLEGVEIDV